MPPSQDGEAAFKGRQRKEIDMSTEISTNTAPARGLALATFDDAWRFWQMVAKTDFAPKDFKGKPEACLLAGQHGAELGLSPMQSLQSIAVINGRPCVWGDAALALVQSSPVCEYVKEYTEGQGDSLTAVCEAKRRGYPAPTVSRFSMADAKRAGLAGKSGPWSQYPERMLALRARGFALRNAFADCLRGLVTAEEAQDYPQAVPTQAVTVTQPEPPAVTEPSVYQKAMQSIVRAKSLDRLDDIRRKVAERLADKSLTRWEHDELAKACLDKAEALDNGTEHFDAAEVAAEAQAR